MAESPDTEARIAQLETEIARLRMDVALATSQVNAHRGLLKSANDRIAKLLGGATQTYLSDGLSYLSDGIGAWYKSVDFLTDPRFVAAYEHGIRSGHRIYGGLGSTEDVGIEWRVAICCWAAVHAKHLPGDFVECGTNTGILSLAVCDYIDFNATGKAFWLFDTFEGVPAEQLNPHEGAIMQAFERQGVALNAIYPECFALAKSNFAPFPNAHLVRGKVPDTLTAAAIDRVCYLSIDMNIEYPEREALAYFWPKLVPGGIVVFDDYGSVNHRQQKDSHDAFAKRHGLEIFALPTGQGLLLKP